MVFHHKTKTTTSSSTMVRYGPGKMQVPHGQTLTEAKKLYAEQARERANNDAQRVTEGDGEETKQQEGADRINNDDDQDCDKQSEEEGETEGEDDNESSSESEEQDSDLLSLQSKDDHDEIVGSGDEDSLIALLEERPDNNSYEAERNRICKLREGNIMVISSIY